MERRSLRDIIKLQEAYSRNAKKCECGHTMAISANTQYVICTWCGRKIFRNKQEEFKYKLGIAKRKKENEKNKSVVQNRTS